MRVGPALRDETSMPTQDRVGLHQQDRLAVSAEHASERGEDRAVGGFKARTRDLASQDGKLMAQHENLHSFGTISTAAQDQQVEHESDETVETSHAPILAAPEPCRSSQRETPGQQPGRVLGTHTPDVPIGAGSAVTG